jgi:transcriptional regulator with GAF, ATPase, and Fis domain
MPLAGSSRHMLGALDEIHIGRGEPLQRRETAAGQRRLIPQIPDARLSREHALIRRAAGGFELVDCASRNGSFVEGARVSQRDLADGDTLELGSTFFVFRWLRDASATPADVEGAGADHDPALATILPELERPFDLLARAAASQLPIVIMGETGTGKELIARAVHARSQRSGAFVPVNCGSLPSTLIEAELFGHRKGAFSGAVDDRPGLVRAADGGTLFLDEIGELPLPAQTLLLRVLQEHEVLPIGHVRPIRVDLRLVCATHRDVRKMVKEGSFRADLLARIQGFTLQLASLAQRRAEFGLIVSTLLGRLAGGRAKQLRFSAGAARRLFDAEWPQNVRGLQRCLEAALVLCDGDTLQLEHVEAAGILDPTDLADGADDPSAEARADLPLSAEDERRRTELIELMRKHDGNVSAIAREIGKARFQVRRWITRYRLR